jgi:nitroimidazol reductase NimA-like FMN-containing flavoprotein (pyridoxamine 5'-phosphate oxidase superfamily)
VNLQNEQNRLKRSDVNEEMVNTFLNEVKIGYLGLVDDNHPYVVPLNFVWHKECIYIHGATKGRKANLMKNKANATFTASQAFGTLTNVVPAHTDTAYLSVMIFGEIEPVQDLLEATEVLDKMLNKYVPGYYQNPLSKQHVSTYVSSAGSHTKVYKLTPDVVTAKFNEVIEERLFFKGRTQLQDMKENNSKN